MAKVRIIHNLSRDASFGLNSVYRTADEKPEGIDAIPFDGKWMWKGTAQKPEERHELAWVFEYQVKGFASDDEILDDAFEMFNIGEGETARDYRGRSLRSLSKGDVVIIDRNAYSCESVGWARRAFRELRILPAGDAEKVIRERYDLGPKEPLIVSVPLPD